MDNFLSRMTKESIEPYVDTDAALCKIKDVRVRLQTAQNVKLFKELQANYFLIMRSDLECEARNAVSRGITPKEVADKYRDAIGIELYQLLKLTYHAQIMAGIIEDLDNWKNPGEADMNSYKTARQSSNLTQEEVAAHFGVDRSTVAKWETGASSPRTGMIADIARLYKCSVDMLIGNEFHNDNHKLESNSSELS